MYAPCCYSFTASYVFMIICLFRQMDSLSLPKWAAERRSALVKSKEGVLITCMHVLFFYKMIFVLLCTFLLVVIKFRYNIFTWGVTLHCCIWNEYQIHFLFAKLCVHRGLGTRKKISNVEDYSINNSLLLMAVTSLGDTITRGQLRATQGYLGTL